MPLMHGPQSLLALPFAPEEMEPVVAPPRRRKRKPRALRAVPSWRCQYGVQADIFHDVSPEWLARVGAPQEAPYPARVKPQTEIPQLDEASTPAQRRAEAAWGVARMVGGASHLQSYCSEAPSMSIRLKSEVAPEDDNQLDKGVLLILAQRATPEEVQAMLGAVPPQRVAELRAQLSDVAAD